VNNFEYYNPVKIIFGKNQINKLSREIPAKSKVLLLYGGGSIFKNKVYDEVTSALKEFEVVEFGGIEPNPTYETAMKAVELIKSRNIDWLLAVGGGSVIDSTKFIAAATFYEAGDPWDILSKNNPFTKALPFGVVLTLPATGSEMNSGGVITKLETREKLAFGNALVFPKFSFLLPEAAASLPPRQVANGVVDAFVHVVEQYLTFKVNAPLQDRYAESILLTLIEEGPKVYANPADYDAMSNLMWCACNALNGLLSSGVSGDWGTHMIGHELTALHGIDHARTLAIVLPGLWSVLRVEKHDKLLQYASRVWNIKEGTDDERIMAAIDKTVDFFESLGIKTKLSDYHVHEDTIELIGSRLQQRGWKVFGDRRLLTPEKTKEILRRQL
jgi:NADP-dependent alcohol dehydrogenase